MTISRQIKLNFKNSERLKFLSEKIIVVKAMNENFCVKKNVPNLIVQVLLGSCLGEGGRVYPVPVLSGSCPGERVL